MAHLVLFVTGIFVLIFFKSVIGAILKPFVLFFRSLKKQYVTTDDLTEFYDNVDTEYKRNYRKWNNLSYTSEYNSYTHFQSVKRYSKIKVYRDLFYKFPQLVTLWEDSFFFGNNVYGDYLEDTLPTELEDIQLKENKIYLEILAPVKDKSVDFIELSKYNDSVTYILKLKQNNRVNKIKSGDVISIQGTVLMISKEHKKYTIYLNQV